jgi:hypothetical protein
LSYGLKRGIPLSRVISDVKELRDEVEVFAEEVEKKN